MTIAIQEGYRAGCIGRIVQLHGLYYARTKGFDVSFEAKVARELAEFCAAFDHQRDGLWLAVQDGEILGSVALDAGQMHDAGAHLRWFIVANEAQGIGIGTKLLAAAVSFAEARQYKRIYLWTFRGLDAARHLYEAQGFRLMQEESGSQWGRVVREQPFVRGKT